MDNFADRLNDAIKQKGNCICVGLDPRLDLIPTEITKRYEHFKSWSPNDYAADSIEDFNKVIIDIVADVAVAVKPQAAFYEEYGWYGMRALEQTIYYAKQKGLIVILDVKRGDIASTAEAYARAYLKNSDADAVTVNPFLGSDSVEPFIKVAQESGKGVFVLVKTSNPGSKDFQDCVVNPDPAQAGRGHPAVAGKMAVDSSRQQRLYEYIADYVVNWGKPLIGRSGYSSVCAVVGATFPEEANRLRSRMPQTIFLIPGYGAQGATGKDLKGYFNKDGLGAIVNASRSIIYAYKDPKAAGWQAKIREALMQMKMDLANMTVPV